MTGSLLFNFWNKACITVWLLLVYIVSLWLVLGALSSYQLQSRINEDNTQNQSGNTVSAVIRQLRAVENFDYQIELAQKEIKSAKLAVQATVIGAYDLEKQVDELSSELEQLWLRSIKTVPLRTETQNSLKQSCAQLRIMKPDVDAQTAAQGNPFDSAIQTCDNAIRVWRDLKYEKREIPIKKLALQAMEFDLRQLENEQSILLLDNNLTRDYLTELTYMKKFRFDFLATMPGQLLTLMLTLSMGALGSIIYLTRALFDSSVQHNFTWYLFRPFLGMIMALAIFVLVKSGQLTITESGGADDLSGLSPFFLSFVAIISGLLSEQAYQKIYTAGQNFFGAEDNSGKRWALNLDTAIQSEGKQTSDLLHHIDASESELDDWITATKPVPQAQQNIISAWLNVPSREIFSDQPPSGVRTERNDQRDTGESSIEGDATENKSPEAHQG